MDLYLIFKIGLLGFALLSWIGYKYDRSKNKQNLNELIDSHIPTRELSTDEILLLEPYLNKTLPVFPYKHQSSLVNINVSEIIGTCIRHSLHTNSNETSYYYEINGIEVFFPYKMERYLEETNVIEVVFTESYAFIVKINGYDLQTAVAGIEEEEQIEEEWQTGRSNSYTNIADEEDDDISDASQPSEKYKKRDYEIIEQREETPLESAIRTKHNTGWLTALFLVLAAIFFVSYWSFGEPKIIIFIIISLLLALFCYWRRPKSKIYKVNRVLGNIDANNPVERKVVVGNTLLFKYPDHWQSFLPENTTANVEMDVSVDDNKLLRYGYTLSIGREIEQFGSPKFLKRNFLLFLTGLIISGIVLYVSNVKDNALFTYRIVNNTANIINIDDTTSLKNISLQKGDLVNIQLSGASCDVTSSAEYNKCQKIIINTQPTTDPNYSLKAIPNWVINLFDDNLIKTKRDKSVERAELHLRLEMELLNQLYKNQSYYSSYSKDVKLTKLLNVGYLISVVNESCELVDLSDCRSVKNTLLELIVPENKPFENWSDLVEFGNKRQDYEEIITEQDNLNLYFAIKRMSTGLLTKQIDLIKSDVKNYQNNESRFSLTLADNQYTEIAMLNNDINSKNEAVLPLIHYYNTLFGIGGKTNITGLVTGIDYHDDNSIANLSVNIDPHYSLAKDELTSFTSPIIINVVFFAIIASITLWNGLMFFLKLIANRRRYKKIISNYANQII